MRRASSVRCADRRTTAHRSARHLDDHGQSAGAFLPHVVVRPDVDGVLDELRPPSASTGMSDPRAPRPASPAACGRDPGRGGRHPVERARTRPQVRGGGQQPGRGIAQPRGHDVTRVGHPRGSGRLAHECLGAPHPGVVVPGSPVGIVGDRRQRHRVLERLAGALPEIGFVSSTSSVPVRPRTNTPSPYSQTLMCPRAERPPPSSPVTSAGCGLPSWHDASGDGRPRASAPGP
jgi:hypothetical protein